jgi:hypothetical protein
VAVAAGGQGHVQIGLGHRRLGQLALGALVQHGHDAADHLQVAQLLGGDVEQQVLAARIVLGQALG